MHETAVAMSLLRILGEEAAKHKVTRITRVQLSVGLFTSIESQTLTACFELLAEGTVAEGAVLNITLEPAHAHCLDCGAQFLLETRRGRCTACGGLRLECSGGQTFCITGIEAEHTAETP